MIDDLKTRAQTDFKIQDIDAEYIRLNNAAGVLGKQLVHSKIYKAASKFAHPTALLLCMRDPLPDLINSFYDMGAKAAVAALNQVEATIKKEYPDFSYR